MKFEAVIDVDRESGKIGYDGRYVSDVTPFFNENSFDVMGFFKVSIRNWLESLSVENVDKSETGTVKLYHGTTSAHLNSILLSGILPSSETDKENWSQVTNEDLRSANNVVYLTNKWHYFYAYAINTMYRQKHEMPMEFWDDWKIVPCYIEVEIPKCFLTCDEDMVHSKYFEQKLNTAMKKNTHIELTWEESLSQYGTAGVLGGVPREYIKSITFLGDPQFYDRHYLTGKSQYAKDVERWSNGKGKGKLKNMDMIKWESESALNATIFMNQIPKNHVITGVQYNEKRDNLDFIINKIG